MAILTAEPYPIPEPDWDRYGYWMLGKEPTDPADIEFKCLLDASDRLDDETVVGTVLMWQVADGYAYYLVTETDPLTVQWIPWGDAWTVDPIMIKGLDLEDVRMMRYNRRRMLSLFAGGGA